MNLEILTPDAKVYDGEITSVTIPGSAGSFEVLKNHAALISTLDDGKVVIRNNGTEKFYFIKGGVIEVKDNKIILLAEGVSEHK